VVVVVATMRLLEYKSEEDAKSKPAKEIPKLRSLRHCRKTLKPTRKAER